MNVARRGLGKVEELAKNLYAVIGEGDTPLTGYGANQFFASSGDGVVVIDTGFDRPIAENLKKLIKSKTDEEIRSVVNTHHHSDHYFGNSVLVENGRTATFSHEYCRNKIAQDGEHLISDYRKSDKQVARALEGIEIVVPKIKYSEKITVIIGNLQFDLIHPREGAHTPGDTYAYFADQKLLVAGDILWNRYYPNCEDANLSGWVNTLERIRRKLPSTSTYLPGHGDVCDKSDFDLFRNYLKRVTQDLNGISRMTVEEVMSVFERYGSSDWKFKTICEYNAKMLSKRFSLGVNKRPKAKRN